MSFPIMLLSTYKDADEGRGRIEDNIVEMMRKNGREEESLHFSALFQTAAWNKSVIDADIINSLLRLMKDKQLLLVIDADIIGSLFRLVKDNNLQLLRDQTKCVADIISALPDEIIELILSKLKLRDAIRTGVLSRRWKHVWEYTTGTLDFDFRYRHEWSLEYDSNGKPKWNERHRVDKARYVSTVSNILNAHKRSTIEEFNVCYDLDIRNKLDVDSWIDFALRKKVCRLKLNFAQPHHLLSGKDFRGAYEFPLPLLKKSKVSCLTSLSLCCVKVTGEDLNYLLSKCPFLESLCVNYLSTDAGVHLASCSKLKHLEIETWSEVLDISSAPNLTSFIFSGAEHTRLSIKNVPNLSRVSLRGFYCAAIMKKSWELPPFLFQLKNLTLELRAAKMTFPKIPKFPELNNINELKLTFTGEDYYEESDLFSCASLMEACPNLYRFSMKLTWAELVKVHKSEKWGIINKCLKVVDLEMFRGEEVELEFYECLLSSAPALDKIIVDISKVYNDEKKHKLDKSVRRLTQHFSPSAELVMKYPRSIWD